MIGEIGGNAEETAAEYVKEECEKPVVGHSSPGRPRLRDAGWAMPAPSFRRTRAPRQKR